MSALTLGGIALSVTSFRREPDEVSPTGIAARNWALVVYCETDAEAGSLHALASHNLRRTIGWQLRGSGHGDVIASGSLIGTATVRVVVEDDSYHRSRDTWYRVLRIRLREQVTL